MFAAVGPGINVAGGEWFVVRLEFDDSKSRCGLDDIRGGSSWRAMSGCGRAAVLRLADLRLRFLLHELSRTSLRSHHVLIHIKATAAAINSTHYIAPINNRREDTHRTFGRPGDQSTSHTEPHLLPALLHFHSRAHFHLTRETALARRVEHRPYSRSQL